LQKRKTISLKKVAVRCRRDKSFDYFFHDNIKQFLIEEESKRKRGQKERKSDV